MIFIADGMLGKLARRLRLLGFDVLFFPRASDDEILAAARKDGRIVLTRDTRMPRGKDGPAVLLVHSERWEDQIAQVLDELDLRDHVRPFSRCISCNGEVKPLAPPDARNLVPPVILETSESFALCPSCGRVFWKGSHYQDMETCIERLLGRNKS
jgi:uncharacterized protein